MKKSFFVMAAAASSRLFILIETKIVSPLSYNSSYKVHGSEKKEESQDISS